MQDNRRGIVRHFWPIAFPLDLSRLSVERRDDSAGVAVGRRNHKRLIDDRRSAISLVNLVVANLPLPALLAVETQSRDIYGAAVRKVNEQVFAVASNRAGRSRRLLVLSHQTAAMHFLLPQWLAGLAVVAKHRLGILLLVRGGEIDAATDDRRRAVPASGNRTLPSDVLRLAPFGRWILIRIRDTVALRPAPPWPVGGTHRDSVVHFLTESLR